MSLVDHVQGLRRLGEDAIENVEDSLCRLRIRETAEEPIETLSGSELGAVVVVALDHRCHEKIQVSGDLLPDLLNFSFSFRIFSPT